MVKVLNQRKNKKVYKQRSYTVEPMQGLLKDIFELERCWMRGNANNRWLFAAMGVAVQMHQYRAWQSEPLTVGHQTGGRGWKGPQERGNARNDGCFRAEPSTMLLMRFWGIAAILIMKIVFLGALRKTTGDT